MQTKPMKTYTLIYRSGGRENGRWNRTLVVGTHAYCRTKAQQCETMGYPALVMTTDGLNALGLPDADESDYNVFNFVFGMAKLMAGA